eukprot:UN33478
MYEGNSEWNYSTSLLNTYVYTENWECYTKFDQVSTTALTTDEPEIVETTDVLSQEYGVFTFIGNGICTDIDRVGSPPNYSKNDVSDSNECANYCINQEDCIGFSFNTNGNRCALWLNNKFEYL